MENILNFSDTNTPINVCQTFSSTDKSQSINANAGFSFSNNGINDFGVKYEFNRTPSNKNSILGTSNYTESDSYKQSEEITLFQDAQKSNHSLNAYYITSLGKGNKLNLNFDCIKGEIQSGYTSVCKQNKNVEAFSTGNFHLYTGKAEISHNLWNGIISYGTEYSDTDNKSSYHTQQNIETSLTESDDENRQQLWSFFVSMKKTFGDFSLYGGLRFDWADYKYYHMKQLQEDVNKNYNKLLPYFQMAYDKSNISLSLSYNSNVHRPSYGQLNGSTVYIDKYTYQQGNPLLHSSYEHITDFMFSWNDLMVDLTHTWYNNSIMQTTKMIEGKRAIILTMENIPSYREWGATINYTPTLSFWHPKIESSVFKQDLYYKEEYYNKPYFTYEFDNLFQILPNLNLSMDL